jgi:hypothetical protein
MRGVQTRQFRRESDPDIVPDGVIEHLEELAALLVGWGGPPGSPGDRS